MNNATQFLNEYRRDNPNRVLMLQIIRNGDIDRYTI